MADDINDLKPQSKPTLRDIIAEIGGNRKELDRIVGGGKYYPGRMNQTQLEAIRLLQAANQTKDPERWLESLNPYGNANIEFNLNNNSEAGYVDKDAPNRAVIQNMRDVANTVPHELTHTLQLNKGAGMGFDQDANILERAQSLSPEMRNSIFPSKNRFDNPLEVWANINARAHNVAAEGGDFINSPEGKAMFPDQAAQRDYYTKSMPGVNSATPDTGTFVPNNESYVDKAKRLMKFADGGLIDPYSTPMDAIKDRVMSPNANEMLNLDLAKLTLANQPRRMAGGGFARKAVKAAEKALSQAEREANLAKMLEESAFKDKLYHGTGSDITEFRPNTFFSDNPQIAGMYAKSQHRAVEGSGPNIIPVHAQLKNPFIFDEADARRQGISFGQSVAPESPARVRHDEALRILKDRGHDSVIFQNFDDIGGRQNQYIIFEPSQIKSATGNRGTYDLTDPDITKKDGGIVHMAGGGAARKAVKAAEKALSQAEREANLAKWSSGSPIKTEEGDPMRLYHATSKDFNQFKAGGEDPTQSGYATWLTNNSEYQPAMHNIGSRSAAFREGANVMPVYSNAKRPLMLDDPDMLNWAQQVFAEGSSEFPMLMPKKWADEVKAAGYDYIHHADPHGSGEPHEYIMLDPERQLKSAIGNRGTYDPNDPDITKKDGGAVHMAGGGFAKKAAKAGVKALSQAEREANLAKMLEESAVKDRMYHGSSNPDIQQFKTGKMKKEENYPNNTIEPWATDNRDAVFLTPDPNFSSKYSGGEYEIGYGASPTTYPVYVQAKNPWDYENPNHLKQVIDTYKEKYPLQRDSSGGVPSDESMRHHRFETNVRELPLRENNNWSAIERAELQDIIQSLGHDSFFVKEAGVKNLGVYDPSKIKSAIGNRGTYDMNDPDITKAEGGLIRMAGGGAARKLSKAAEKALQLIEAEKAAALAKAERDALGFTAADRAAAGRAAEKLINSQPQLPMSEALGNLNVEGTGKLTTTQADRTRVGGGNIGGAAFSGISEAHPAYEGKVWGVQDSGTASRLTNLNDPNTIWTTMLGSANQLKTNPIVFAKLEKQFKDSMKAGNLSPELEAKINHNLALTFGEGAEIRDPNIWKQADTFEKRAALADLMMGQGIAPGKGGVALGGEKSGKGVIFKPTEILKKETEPSLIHPEHGGDIPTFAAGPRLFTLNNETSYRPDLHPGFPTLLHGEDLGYNVKPVPTEIALPDWHQRFKENNPERKAPGYYDLALGVKGEGLPSQPITEEYLTWLQKHSHKDGGAIHMDEGGEASQAELDRMKYELSRAEHPDSPVMEATPQSFTQKAIGTVGGYMNRAGKFISDTLEPIAETNPRQHFLADMFLADPLKSAGTALQDYTGTVRETDEDNPVRGVISKDWRNLTTSREPMLDPRVLDIAQFAQPAASLATKAVSAGAKAVTPFAKNAAEMANELYMAGKMPGMVAPASYMTEPVRATERVLAPANEMGFYSPVEAAALNLQRKSGNGQAFLNDIMKGENVRPDEISTMGLDTFLSGKKSVTADEVKDYIANNKIQLGENKYGERTPRDLSAEYDRLAKLEYGKSYGELQHDAQVDIERYVDKDTSQYKEYSTPGGSNYREVVLTLQPKPISEAEAKSVAGEAAWNVMSPEQRTQFMAGTRESDKRNAYKSSHWEDKNPVAHLRMQDFTDVDGKKTLLVDEVQSDWHQAGREKGYKSESNVAQTAHRGYANDIKNRFADAIREEYAPTTGYPDELNKLVKNKVEDSSIRDMAEYLGESDKLNNSLNAYTSEIDKNRKGVPNAPFKDDWYQLALKRAIKEAVDNGYDRVALPTGQRVAERFDLSKQIDRIDYNKNPDNTYTMSAIKDGREIFSKEDIDEKELSGIIGKDLARKIVNDEGKAPSSKADRWEPEDGETPEFKSLSGLDLKVGGEGMKKYYDEIYPGYLKKFGKRYGAKVGQSEVTTPHKYTNEELSEMFDSEGRVGESYTDFVYRVRDQGKPETIHYMDITPAMREAFKTGIHMAEGGIVNGNNGLNYVDGENVSMESGGYVPLKRGGKVEFTTDLKKMRHELNKGRK